MDVSKFESMWKIMRENNFEIYEEINSEYVCTICNKILIDACNAPCGCRYCKNCITDYLNDGRRVCPGISEFCNVEVINIDCDIQVDRAINTRISRLIAKCPHELCQTKVDLRSMEKHLETCEYRDVFCPFKNIGCEEYKLPNIEVDEHLSSDIHLHSKLLVDWINFSRIEIESLKKDVKQLRSENYDLKSMIKTTENDIRDLQRENKERTIVSRIDTEKKLEIVENKINIDITRKIGSIEKSIRQLQKIERENTEEIDKLGDEMCYLKNENRFMKGELRTVQNKDQISNVDLKNQIEKYSAEIDKLKRQYQQNEIQSEIQERTNNDFEIKLNELSLANSYFHTESIKTIQSIESLQENVDRSREFVWKIENWSDKCKQAQHGIIDYLCSNSFFSHKNGYKMRLGLLSDAFYNEKGNRASLGYCIMKGPFDDMLQWPFQCDVVLTLMNQHTGAAYSIKTLKYSDKPEDIEIFEKPVNEKISGFDRPQLTEVPNISGIRSLCHNNQVFIKCSVRLNPIQHKKTVPRDSWLKK